MLLPSVKLVGTSLYFRVIVIDTNTSSHRSSYGVVVEKQTLYHN